MMQIYKLFVCVHTFFNFFSIFFLAEPKSTKKPHHTGEVSFCKKCLLIRFGVLPKQKALFGFT